MTFRTEAKILVIGMGNPLRGDDAAGRMVAERLRERRLPSVRVIGHDGEGASLMEAWIGARTVIVVDAVSSDSRPGSIFRFDAAQQPLPGKIFQCSAHALGLHEAVELSRALNRLPQRFIIYGIAGKSFGIGGPLSAEVKEGVRQVVERVLEEPGVRF